jgi:hypothetical protein
MNERIEELEGSLRDIILGCDTMLQVESSPAQRRFINEVRRVASAPLVEANNIVTSIGMPLERTA